MELFTRTAVLEGPPMAAREWAAEIAQAYTAACGKEVAVWSHVVGGTPGTMTWALELDGAAELLELSAVALADEAYLATIERGRDHLTGAMTDTMLRAFGHPSAYEGGPGDVCRVNTAVSQSGSLGHAVGWGLEIAEYVSRFTGIETNLWGTTAGRFSRLTWIAITDDARAADEADRSLNRDDEYLKLIARGGGYFQDGSARSTLFARIA